MIQSPLHSLLSTRTFAFLAALVLAAIFLIAVRNRFIRLFFWVSIFSLCSSYSAILYIHMRDKRLQGRETRTVSLTIGSSDGFGLLSNCESAVS